MPGSKHELPSPELMPVTLANISADTVLVPPMSLGIRSGCPPRTSASVPDPRSSLPGSSGLTPYRRSSTQSRTGCGCRRVSAFIPPPSSSPMWTPCFRLWLRCLRLPASSTVRPSTPSNASCTPVAEVGDGNTSWTGRTTAPRNAPGNRPAPSRTLPLSLTSGAAGAALGLQEPSLDGGSCQNPSPQASLSQLADLHHGPHLPAYPSRGFPPRHTYVTNRDYIRKYHHHPAHHSVTVSSDP
uniref:Uncharacterized protein n=1 Tax=Nothobranchius pienaari TaxID=704102 RepID=A0A1A8R2I6_9TELE